MDKSANMRGLVRFAWVRDPRSVGDFAGGAVVGFAFLDGDGYVSGEVAQAPDEVVTHVEPRR